MAIAQSGAHEEEIGGQSRRLVLRNSEIERFEVQHAPLGIYELFDQLFGRGPAPQVRHVRDLIALGLVGGGMTDKAADALIASLPPSENLNLRLIAQRLIGLTFLPAVLDDKPGKPEAGSQEQGANDQPKRTTRPKRKSRTSAA